jgi:rhodanese-related sulfurtransferase
MSNIIIVAVMLVVYIVYQKWSMRNIKSIDGPALKLLMADKPKKVQFIDVRTAGEYQQNHLKGFQNLPLDQLSKRKETLKKDQPIIVMCASGSRSSKACKILASNGFQDITNLKGGISHF